MKTLHVSRSRLAARSLLAFSFASGLHVGQSPLASARELEELTIPSGELRFHALAAGPLDGEPVLLLHGFPQTSWSFRHQLAALGESGYRAVAPDQRGYSPGARPQRVEDYAMPHLVEDVLGMASALGFERFHLVGHDWGGAVAWVTATGHAERLLSLTVVSTPHYAAFARARAEAGSDQARRSRYMARFAEAGSEQDFLADDAAALRKLLTGPGIGDADRKKYLEVLGTPDALRAALNWYSALAASTASTPAGAAPAGVPPVRVRTLYVWGTADVAFGRVAAEATREHVAGPYRFELLEGVGHWVPEQAAERLCELLLEHLEGSH